MLSAAVPYSNVVELLVGQLSTEPAVAVVSAVVLLADPTRFSVDTVVQEKVVTPSKLVGALVTVTATWGIG